MPKGMFTDAKKHSYGCQKALLLIRMEQLLIGKALLLIVKDYSVKSVHGI